MKDRVILKYRHVPGGSCIATAISNVMNYYGHGYSQDFITSSCINFGFMSDPMNNLWTVEFISSKMMLPIFLENTGLTGKEIQLEDNGKALKAMLEMIEDKNPVIVKVDPSHAKWLRRSIPSNIISLMPAHTIVIYGYDLNEHKIYFYDNAYFNNIELDMEQMCIARNSGNTNPINSFDIFLNNQMPFNLEETYLMALMGTVVRYKYTEKFLGFRMGFKALDRLIGNVYGWGSLSDEQLRQRSLSLRMSLTNGLAVKGAFRNNFSRFLSEASNVVGIDFGDVSKIYSRTARNWTDVDSMLNGIMKKSNNRYFEKKSNFITAFQNAVDGEKMAIDALEEKLKL